MALSQSDLTRLETALAQGEMTVEYDGRRVTFRSVAELKDAIAYVKGELAAQTAGGNVTTSYASFARD
ncbi:MAG: phage head-tail joining protein [Reyranellaceae bacterium]